MYCLWLNGKKVFTLQQLRSSFDAEAVELYCLGGGLSRWLKDSGELEIAEKVDHIDLSQSISRQLAEIFGVEVPKKEEQEYRPAPTANAPLPSSSSSFSLPSSFSEASFSFSFNTTSFTLSNEYTSFFNTSFLTGSFFGGHEYEYEYESGSFTINSFSLYSGSFSAETAFSTGSFAFGATSFTLGSFTSEYGSFTFGSSFFPSALSSFSPNSAEAEPSAASASTPEGEQPSLTPQQKFRINLSSNPLNRYGYGIHII